MVILYISFPVCLEKQETRGAGVKIQNRGLSFKLANFSFARGQSWLCHWVNRDSCPRSPEGFKRAGKGKGVSLRTRENFLSYMWPHISLPIVRVEGYGMCSIRRKIIRQTRFQVLGIFKICENCLFLVTFMGNLNPCSHVVPNLLFLVYSTYNSVNKKTNVTRPGPSTKSHAAWWILFQE